MQQVESNDWKPSQLEKYPMEERTLGTLDSIPKYFIIGALILLLLYILTLFFVRVIL